MCPSVTLSGQKGQPEFSGSGQKHFIKAEKCRNLRSCKNAATAEVNYVRIVTMQAAVSHVPTVNVLHNKGFHHTRWTLRNLSNSNKPGRMLSKLFLFQSVIRSFVIPNSKK